MSSNCTESQLVMLIIQKCQNRLRVSDFQVCFDPPEWILDLNTCGQNASTEIVAKCKLEEFLRLLIVSPVHCPERRIEGLS